MTQHDKTPLNSKSGQEVAKRSNLQTRKRAASKYSAEYWRDRIVRPTYSKDGKKGQVQQWHARIQAAGRRQWVGLNTNNREEAARTAARLYGEITAKGWDAAIAAFNPDKVKKAEVETVGEFLRAVEESADTLSPRTLYGYTSSFRWLVAAVFGIEGDKSRFDYRKGGNDRWRAKIDGKKLSDLTPQKIEHALSKFITKAGASPVDQNKAKRSAASVARQARALFSRKMLRRLPFDHVPNPFQGVEIEGAKVRKYVGTMNAEKLFADARGELDGEAYKAFLLALGTGLRRKEIDNLQWQQIDAEKSVIRIRTTEDFGAKTEDSEDQVFVDPGLVSELMRFRESATGLFVLEGGESRPNAKYAYYRANDAFKRFITWLRVKGVMDNKPIHTLRKEFGSMIAATSDIHTASRQLRHSNIQTAASYYLDHRRKVSPPIGDWMGKSEEANTEAGS